MVMISSATFVVLCRAYSRVGCGPTVHVVALEKKLEEGVWWRRRGAHENGPCSTDSWRERERHA